MTFGIPALADDGKLVINDYGYGREIVIYPDTKWVNVMKFETVRFVVQANGKSFSWQFAGAGKVDITAVAPAGMLDHQVTAYVSHGSMGD
jgi:hypothetical protein